MTSVGHLLTKKRLYQYACGGCEPLDIRIRGSAHCLDVQPHCAALAGARPQHPHIVRSPNLGANLEPLTIADKLILHIGRGMTDMESSDIPEVGRSLSLLDCGSANTSHFLSLQMEKAQSTRIFLSTDVTSPRFPTKP